MERGAQALVRIMLASLVLGLLTLLFHPDYRAALQAVWRGEPSESPVWQTNERYYSEVTLKVERPDVQSE